MIAIHTDRSGIEPSVFRGSERDCRHGPQSRSEFKICGDSYKPQRDWEF